MKRFSFKEFSYGSLIAILLLIIGCEKNANLPVINVLGEDTATLSAIEEIKRAFEEENNVHVNIVKNTFEVLQQKAGQDLSNGTGLYDIILNYNFSLSSYTKNNWVLTKDEYIKYFNPNIVHLIEENLFHNVWMETGYYRINRDQDPKAIGYPFAGNTMLLVYNKNFFNNDENKDMYFKKYGMRLVPPSTWQEFKNIAEFFTNLQPGLSGVVLEGASGGWLYYEICNFIYGMGGGILDKEYGWEGDSNTPVIIDSPKSINALKYYFSLKPFNAGDYFSTGQNEQVEIMRGQKAAMAIMWSDVLYSLISGADSTLYGFAPIPGNSSVIGGGIYYINRESKNIPLSAKFIEYIVQENNQVNLMVHGLCSAFQNVYANPQIEKIPYAKALFISLKRGKYMHEAGPDADAIQVSITNMIQRVWKGDLSVEDGVKQAKKEIIEKRKEIFMLLNK